MYFQITVNISRRLKVGKSYFQQRKKDLICYSDKCGKSSITGMVAIELYRV